jgi:hypothetical protein
VDFEKAFKPLLSLGCVIFPVSVFLWRYAISVERIARRQRRRTCVFWCCWGYWYDLRTLRLKHNPILRDNGQDRWLSTCTIRHSAAPAPTNALYIRNNISRHFCHI